MHERKADFFFLSADHARGARRFSPVVEFFEGVKKRRVARRRSTKKINPLAMSKNG